MYKVNTKFVIEMRSIDLGLADTLPAPRSGQAGFTLLEMLVVVTIIALVAGMTVGVSGALKGSRGSTAIQQLAAVIDTARAKALTGQGEVVLAFATEAVPNQEAAYRAVLICQAQRVAGRNDHLYEPVSGWYYLPEGYVFTQANPASSEAGINVLNATDARQRVQLPGGRQEVSLPCIGFRDLGQVSLPAETRGRPVLVAIAEGEVTGGNPRTPQGLTHTPEMCRWLAVQKHSGNSQILP